MELPPTDLVWFADSLTELVEQIVDVWNNSDVVAAHDEAPPELIRDALSQLIDVLEAYEWKSVGRDRHLDDHSGDGIDVSELGEYGLSLLGELTQLATDLGLDELPEQMEQLSISLAFWVIRHQGELRSVELVVNGLARLSNHTREQADLKQLFHVMGEVLEGLPPGSHRRRGDDAGDTADARRILLLNRAIVATRALSPALMITAFSDVAEELPENAPGFFREGMEQIGIQNYPRDVSAIIERFHRDWPLVKILH